MSYLSEELKRQLDEIGENAIYVAAKTDISASMLYKWMRGEQTHISETDLTKISNAIYKTKEDKARLVFAHLMDERFGPGHKLVRIEIDSPAALKETRAKPTKGEAAFHFLAELRITNNEVNDFIIAYARCMGAKL